MGTEKFNRQANQVLCKDEMNLAEFPLSIIGKRVPKGVKTIEFQDAIKNPKSGGMIQRHLTVTGSDLLGLPTSLDDEVLVGCLKLTKDYRFEQRRVPFTAYQLLEEIGWSRKTKSYRRLSQSLDRWSGTRVYSNNAFWHKGQQKLVKDSFGVIDRWRLTDDTRKDSDKAGWFLWGDFFWESLQAGNIRTLDFGFWKSLDSPVSKRLFRLLDKRFYKRTTVTFPLETLAYDKVGVSRNLHTGQIKETLDKGHLELANRGFCVSSYVKRGRGNWEVVYTDARKSNKAVHSCKKGTSRNPLVNALAERGVKNGSQLVEKFPQAKIEAAIENFDDRRNHGEDLGPGWLGKCILDPHGFGHRKGYRSNSQQQERKRKAENAFKAKKLAAQKQQAKAEAARRLRVDRFLATLPDNDAREAIFKEALASNSMVVEFYHKEKAAGGENLEYYRYSLLFQHLERIDADLI